MSEKPRLFVTGGSGFIGGHVIEHFSPTHEVLALARSEEAAATVEARGAKAIRGSLEEVTAEYLQGVDAVVHCAAFVGEFAPWAAFRSANVVGTRLMLDAARNADVRRFVHISTEAVLFSGRDLNQVDEDSPYPAAQRYPYSGTKAEAERLALEEKEMETIVLRPRLVWGPRDTVVLPSLTRVVDQGSWFWIGGGRGFTSTTHVDNIVHAIDLAMEGGQPGQCYFIADEGTRTYRDFFTRLGATAGVVFPDRSLPSGLLALAGRVMEALWRCTPLRGAPPFTEFGAGIFAATITVNTDKARADLGYAPVTSVEDGLARLEKDSTSS